MSDTRLRELERRWKETGSPDDEAAYLLERVRVGDLTRERLELAAYCGHEGARSAIGSVSEAPLSTDELLGDGWGGRPSFFLRWGHKPCVIPTMAIAQSLLPLWNRSRPEDRRPRNALETVANWIEGTAEHGVLTEAALGAADAAIEVATALPEWSNLGDAALSAAMAAEAAALPVDAAQELPRVAMARAIVGANSPDRWPERSLPIVTVRQVVLAAMIGWALR